MLSDGLLDTGCAFLLCLGTTGRDASRSPHLYRPMAPGRSTETLERTKAAAMVGTHLKGSPEGGSLVEEVWWEDGRWNGPQLPSLVPPPCPLTRVWSRRSPALSRRVAMGKSLTVQKSTRFAQVLLCPHFLYPL